MILPQLDRISSIATLSNVWIGVIPAGAPIPGIPEHNFQLYEERDDDQEPVVRIELVHARVTVSEPVDVAVYMRQFTSFRDYAVSGPSLTTYLLEMARELQ